MRFRVEGLEVRVQGSRGFMFRGYERQEDFGVRVLGVSFGKGMSDGSSELRCMCEGERAREKRERESAREIAGEMWAGSGKASKGSGFRHYS